MATNYEAALKAEAKKVVRVFQRYTVDQIVTLYSKPGRPCRKALDRGEFFYIHPAIPGIAFRTRGQAAERALTIP